MGHIAGQATSKHSKRQYSKHPLKGIKIDLIL